MARYPSMITRVIELLAEGKSTKEIMDEVKCSKSTVTVARNRIKAHEEVDKTNDVTTETPAEDGDSDPTEDETDAAIDSFIKRIKITPPPEEKAKEKEDEMEEYTCAQCMHTWEASKKEFQATCPGCGQEF